MFSQFRHQSPYAGMYTGNFGISSNFSKKEGLYPKKGISFWEILLTEVTTLLKLFSSYFYTNLNTLTSSYFLEAIMNLATLLSFMVSMTKSQKNMVIIMYGITSTILLTIFPSRQLSKDRSFAFMEDFHLKDPRLTL